MSHLLPPLQYDIAALEPHVDARTMQLHHDLHHASYVKALNLALGSAPERLRGKTAAWLLQNLESVPADIRIAVQHNAGGHVNHSLLWRAMTPTGGGTPPVQLAQDIEHSFGSLEKFKAKFVEAGSTLFGSGWVWLVCTQDSDETLQVLTTTGHDNPLAQGCAPLLVNDVWEHAYYLKHENRRAEYLEAWWSVVDWNEAARRHARARSAKGSVRSRTDSPPRQAHAAAANS